MAILPTIARNSFRRETSAKDKGLRTMVDRVMAARGALIRELWVCPQNLETAGRVDDGLSRGAPRAVIREYQVEETSDHAVSLPAPSWMIYLVLDTVGCSNKNTVDWMHWECE